MDKTLEAGLFSSALTRLEEAPLRFVDSEHYSSPWQELLSSKAFQKAMEIVPELKNKFIEIAKDRLEVVKTVTLTNGKTDEK